MLKFINRYNNASVQVKASFWFLISSFFQKGISVITTPIFTRLLSTEEYGQYNVFNSYLGIITILVSLSLAGGVYSQGLVKFSNDRNKFSSSLQGLSTCLVFLWMIIYAIFHDFLNRVFDLSTVQMTSMLILIWTTAVFNFWAAEQRVVYNYKPLIIITLFVSILKPAIGIILVLNVEDKVTARIVGLALVELIAYIGLFFSQMIRGKCFYSKKYWSYALRFNIPLIPHYLSQTVLNSADRIMIERLCGASEAGIYSLGYSIAQIMLLFNNALTQTITPWMYQKIKEQKIKDISRIGYISLFVIATVNCILILIAPEAVSIFAPKEYYEAVWIIPPVAMSVYFMYAYDLFAKFAFYYEKTNFVMAASMIGAILNIILNYIAIRKWGFIAAGYTTLICYTIYCIGHYIFMNKVCDLFCEGIKPYNTKIILCISITFILIGLFLLVVYNYPIIRYVLLIIFIATTIKKHKKIIYYFTGR